jgi:catechol 2,3-dioxygenase-like lactoylglutathione lyase family enzyme
MPKLDLSVVSIPVSDQDRAKAFYTEVLGFEAVSDNPYRDGLRWVQVRPPGSSTSFTLVTWFPSMPSGSLQGLVVETPDVQAAYLELLEKGVHFVHEPRKEFWGTFTTFSDPDGNGFVLSQAEDRTKG